jgi:dipeptidase D
MSHPRIWFEKISQIPRGSLNEAKIAEFLVEFAREHQLSAIRDHMNNVLIVSPVKMAVSML